MNPIKNLFSFKTVNSENRTLLVFSIGKKEEINYSHVELLSKDSSRDYLLTFQCKKTSKTNKISFDVSGLIPVSEVMRSELRQEQYFDIITGIQKIVSFCKRSGLYYDNLICDPRYIYFNSASKRILMVYLPLKNPYYICDSISRCLINIHKSAKSILISDGKFFNKYEKFLDGFANQDKKNENIIFCDSLQRFFNENDRSRASSDEIEYTGDLQEKTPQTAYPAGGMAVQGIRPVIPDNIPADSISGTVCIDTFRERKTVPLPSAAPVSDIYLTNSEGVRTYINKTPFSIGRDPSKDMILEYPTVSGDHAVITEENGHYYLKDVSTNGTFLNSQDNKITYTEISDGDVIYFDEYSFTFSVAETAPDERSRTVMLPRKQQSPETGASYADPGGRAAAYLKKISDNSVIKIMSFPFTDPRTDGTVIYSLDKEGTVSIYIMNISAKYLAFEGASVTEGAAAEIFSGCTLDINDTKYTFIVEN